MRSRILPRPGRPPMHPRRPSRDRYCVIPVPRPRKPEVGARRSSPKPRYGSSSSDADAEVADRRRLPAISPECSVCRRAAMLRLGLDHCHLRRLTPPSLVLHDRSVWTAPPLRWAIAGLGHVGGPKPHRDERFRPVIEVTRLSECHIPAGPRDVSVPDPMPHGLAPRAVRALGHVARPASHRGRVLPRALRPKAIAQGARMMSRDLSASVGLQWRSGPGPHGAWPRSTRARLASGQMNPISRRRHWVAMLPLLARIRGMLPNATALGRRRQEASPASQRRDLG